MAERPTYAEIVADAKRNVPCGVLTKADREGLIKRGIVMNIGAVDILTLLDTLPPRHRVTRGIE